MTKNIVADYGATCNGVANDVAAFNSFSSFALTWQMSNTGLIELDIPNTATCMFLTTAANTWAQGIKQLLVNSSGGTGAIISDGGTNNIPRLAGFGQINDNLHSARTQTAQAGATSVTLVTPSQASRFTVGQWALIAGIDMQGSGYPSNPAFFDYVLISGADTMTGIISFNTSCGDCTALTHQYKSTWPVYAPGDSSHLDLGGPATLYALDPSWDTEVEYRGITISSTGQTFGIGRRVSFTNGASTGVMCTIPTENHIFTLTNMDDHTCAIEADKIVDQVNITGGTFDQIFFQSQSVKQLNMTGATVLTDFHGQPVSSVISNTSFANFRVGLYGYGATRQISCTSCSISGTFLASVPDVPVNVYSMSGGIITAPNSDGAQPWAIPGAHAMFNGRYRNLSEFIVTDLTQDATNTYIATNLTGTYPAFDANLQDTGGVIRAWSYPAPLITCAGCTGNPSAVDLAQNPKPGPLFSYAKRTYAGNIGTSQAIVPLWGTIIRAKFTVTKPYTGVQSSLLFTLDGPYVENPNLTRAIWDPQINLKIAGERDVFPGSVTGAQSGDSLSAPGAIWLFDDQIIPTVATDISGENPSVYPSIDIEIQTTQGVYLYSSSSYGGPISFGGPIAGK